MVGYIVGDRDNRYSSLIPRDQRFPKLFINTSNWPTPITFKGNTRESKELFYAILPEWGNYKIPLGYVCIIKQYIILFVLFCTYFRILKGVLGVSGEINAETKGILISHDIQEDPYPNDIDQYFPPPFSVEEELKHRKDFRYSTFFY